MANKPIELKDKTDGSILLPKTSTKLVYNDEGKSIDNITEEIKITVEENKTNIDELDTKVGDKKEITPAHYELDNATGTFTVVADDKVDFDELTEVKVTDANKNNNETPFIEGDKVNFVAEVVTKGASGIFQYVDEKVLEAQAGGEIDLSGYQLKVDNNLTTDDKNLINVVNDLADNSHYHEAFTDTEIEQLFTDLEPEEVKLYQNLINDQTVSTNRIFSSQGVVDRITETLLQSQKYANDLVKNMNSMTCKVLDTKPDTGEELVLYLIGASGNYHQWMFIEGAWADLGSTNITLNGYITEDKLTEELAKKADDDKVLKLDKITTTMSNTPSNDNVLSELAIKNLLDGKADNTSIPTNVSELTNDSGYITSSDIPSIPTVTNDLTDALKANYDAAYTHSQEAHFDGNYNSLTNKPTIPTVTTTINSSSTDTQVPSAKSVYTRTKGIMINNSNINTYGTEILKYPVGRWLITTNSIAAQYSDLPVQTAGIIDIETIMGADDKNPWNSTYAYRLYTFKTYNENTYIRKITSTMNAGSISLDTGWQRLCTTTVADVAKTTLESLSGGRFLETSGSDRTYYIVKNGICFVNIDVTTVNPVANTWYELYKLPKPVYKIFNIIPNYTDNSTGAAGEPVYTQMDTDGSLRIRYNATTSGKRFMGSFSYPVAES